MVPCRFLHALAFVGMFLGQAAAQRSIAVIDFEPRGVEPHEAAIIADRFRGQLVRSGIFQVMERGQMEAVLKEQGFQNSGSCTDASCVVEMGQLLSVNSIATGSVGKIGTMYTVDVKVIDIKTGQIRMTMSKDVKGAIEDVLTTAVPSMCDDMVREVSAAAVNVGYVTVTSSPSGAAVLLDLKEVGTTPVKGLEAESGSLRVDVRLQGYAPQQRDAQVVKGQALELDFSLSPTSELLAEQKEQAGARRKKLGRVFRWAGAVVAVAGAGAAAVLWADANSTYDDYSASHDPDELPGLWDGAQSSATYGNISAIVGCVGAIALGVSFAF